MSQLILAAQRRENTGKGVNRRLRAQKMIPAVFYGPHADTTLLTVSYADLQKLIKQARTENIIFDLQIESQGGTQTKKVLLKELQSDPLKEIYQHADFYEISMDKELTVKVPVRLVNIPVGVGKGGVLQHTRRELLVSCLPDRIPEYIEVDVANLDIGQSIQVKDIQFGEGITSRLDGQVSVAGVVAPSAVPEKAEVKEEAVEGEEGAEKAEGEAEVKKEEAE
jgi:large subunit ribosomal protein L25